MLTATLAAIAIVTQDQVPLLAAPRASAAQHAVMWKGDSLEIRGTKGDYLQVYDHRRERAGYIRATLVRTHSLKKESAPELLSVVRFVKDTPGSESLGIAYVGAYLRAAPAEAIDGEPFAALGEMADRLAQRASIRKSGTAATSVMAHLEVAAQYGVKIDSFEREGELQFCYDGEAQRRVLALSSSEEDKARAALSLSQHECVSPKLTPVERYQWDSWRAYILDKVNSAELPDVLKNRIQMRRAGVWASLAYQRVRRPDLGPEAVMAAGSRALKELAAINKAELVDRSDLLSYSDAAIRVGASRWAAEPQPATSVTTSVKLGIVITQDKPGETCVHLVDEKHGVKNPLLTRCTYSVVWPGSVSVSRDGKALALAVQPLDTWREMWVFQQDAQGWHVDVVPPGVDSPDLGYVEFAGWVPGGKQMLAARELKVENRYKTTFELLKQNSLEVERWADKPSSLSPFYRWQDPLWKGGTVTLR
ncbi:MAG: hypothetical protein ACRDD3_11210 [Azovibrio sp.]